MGWTFEDIGELTFPQLRCLEHEGNPPAYPVRKFASMAEAEEYRKQFSAPGKSRSRS